jgi:hypothetical protein
MGFNRGIIALLNGSLRGVKSIKGVFGIYILGMLF